MAVYIAFFCLGVSTLVACGNIAGCVGAVIRKKRGIDQGYSSIPLVSILFSFLAWALGGQAIGPLAFIPAALDPGTWMLIALPFAFVDVIRPDRNDTERSSNAAGRYQSTDPEMDITMALRLLGPLASLAVQRRYITGGSPESYAIPSELLNDGDRFINYPRLGATASLPSLKKFAHNLDLVVQTIPFDDPTFSNEMLVEQNPQWNELRRAAKTVLQEIGAPFDEWELQTLEDFVEKGNNRIYTGAIVFSTCCAIGIFSMSVWLQDFWILSALFGVLLAYYYHSPSPNMIDGIIVIFGSIMFAVAGMFLSKPLLFISISFFFIWFINSALTGVAVMNLQEKNKDTQQHQDKPQ